MEKKQKHGQREPDDATHSCPPSRKFEAAGEEIGDLTYVGCFRDLRDGDLEATKSFLYNHPEAKFAEIYYVKQEHVQDGPRDEASETENIEDFTFRDLFVALRDGELEATKTFLNDHPDAKSVEISPGKTTLNLAIQYGHVRIVEWLLEELPSDVLEKRLGLQKITPLHVAVMAKNKTIAELLVKKNLKLLHIPNCLYRVPLGMACLSRQEEMARYLYSIHYSGWTTSIDRVRETNETLKKQFDDQVELTMLLNDSITGELYDIALDTLKLWKDLAFTCDIRGVYVLNALAGKPSAFHSGSKLVFWQRWIYACTYIEPDKEKQDQEKRLNESRRKGPHEALNRTWAMLWKLLKRTVPGIKDIYDEKLKHGQALEILRIATQTIVETDDLEFQLKLCLLEPLFKASQNGIVEFVTEIAKRYPLAIFATDKDKKNIFHVATSQRHEKIFSLLYNMGTIKNMIAESTDKNGNNMLHFAAELAPPSQLGRVSGAALQMQRELQWFKEVQDILPPYYMEEANQNGLTPQEIFDGKHKKLMEDGQKWMKEVATSCTVVAALTVTIMFAVAFSVPGGYNEVTGLPKFLHKKALMAFIISDAFSLFSSATSVLVFLGMLTSRYKEGDFLTSLPQKLIIGLSSLFFSIAAMMITFCSALVITLQEQLAWNSISIICGSSIPISVFAFMQFPLLVKITMLTFWPGIFDKPKKPCVTLSNLAACLCHLAQQMSMPSSSTKVR